MIKIPTNSIDKIIKNQKNLKAGKSVNLESLNAEKKDECIEIFATVNNSYNNECGITYDTKTNIIKSYYCDCPFCTQFSACGHIYAMLKKYNELDIEEFPFSMDFYNVYHRDDYFDYLSNKFVELYKDNHKCFNPITLPLKGKLHISTNFNNLKDNYISFKIGTKSFYTIKDTYEFYTNVIENKYHEFGKELKVNLTYEIFDEHSKKIIDILDNQSTSNYNKGKFFINSHNVFKFLECYKDNPEFNYKIDEETVRLRVTFTKESGYYYIQLNHYNNSSKFVRVDHTSEKYIITTYEGGDDVANFIDTFTKNMNFISKADMQNFFNYALKDIYKYIDIVGYKFEYNGNEIIKVFGDIYDENNLCFKLFSTTENDDKREYAFSYEDIYNKKLLRIENFILGFSDSIDKDNKVSIMSLNKNNTHLFLDEGIKELHKYCEVYISETLRNINHPIKYNFNIGVKIQNNLLEIDFESLDLPKEELSSILRAYKKKKRFFKLKDGKIISLDSKDLKELDEFIEEYNVNISELDKDKTTLNLFRAMSINDSITNSNEIKYKEHSSFTEMIKSMKDSHKPIKIKDTYSIILRDYQIIGVNWIDKLRKFNFSGILADDMGLGKTLQVIAYLDSLESTIPSIVITPASLILNWQDEIQKFSKDLKCLCIYGSLDTRKNAILDISSYDVIITSYDYIKRDLQLYKDIKFNYVILDEAQYIKNQLTKNASSVKKLDCNYKLALTGTPIENSLAELWSMFDFLMPGYLFNYNFFKSNFETEIIKNNNEQIKNKLKKMVEPFILRRNKKDVLKELPEKIEQIIKIDFSEEEKKLYYANLASISEELQARIKDNNFDKIMVLAMLTRLRQLCIEPRLIYENINVLSSKLESALDIIDTYKQNNKKLLFFSSFTGAFKLLIPILEKEKIKYHILTGETEKTVRRELVNKFQNDDSTIFLISLKAGGTGLNLTSAEGVIHFDPWWNLSAQNQATDRSHRIGQNNNVYVYKLIIKNSIEEKILALQEKKKNLADTFIEGNDGSISKMSTEDILELFTI